MSDGIKHLVAGDTLLANYRVNGKVEDVNDAVSEYRLALGHSEEDTDDKLRAQIALATGLRIQFEEGLVGEKGFEESLGLAERTLEDVVKPSPLYLEAWMTVAEILLRRDRTPDEQSSLRAVDVSSQLVDLLSDAPSPKRVKSLCIYATALTKRMIFFGDKEALSKANSAMDYALDLAEGKVEIVPELTLVLGGARTRRFTITEHMEDIIQTIEALERAIPRLPLFHPSLHRYFSLLGFSFALQYQHKRDEDALDQAVAWYSQAAERVPLHSPTWHIAHGNYAAALGFRFDLRSRLEDLDETVAIMRRVVSRLSDSSWLQKPTGSDVFLGNLGTSLEQSYAQYGRLELLDEAITIHLQNLEVVPPVRRNHALEAVGRSYRTRFQAHGRLSDLENAISLVRQALSSAVLDKETWLSTFALADALVRMYEEREDEHDLEEAVSIIRENINISDPHVQARSRSLLGKALLLRFTSKGKTEDIEEAVESQRIALATLPAGHVDRAAAYLRLGEAEYELALKGHDVSLAYASAIDFDSALAALADHHPDRALFLRTRAKTELLLAELMGEAHFEDAFKSLREASYHEASWVTERYAAATEWAKTAHDTMRLEEAIEAYRIGVDLLPRLAWIGLEETLRMQRLSKVAPDLAQDAAACAISLGNCQLAVELSEAARSVLWNASQELRADLSRLKEEAPKLAIELAEISAALEIRPSAHSKRNLEDGKGITETERVRIHRLASRRAELVALIRERRGFDRFLVPPTYEDLSSVSDDGPVVIVNSSTYRCDALILRANHPVSLLPLSTLRREDIVQEASVLQCCLQVPKDVRGLRFLELKLMEALRRLWSSVGEPVCNMLFEGNEPGPDVPRLWWCPIGPMSFLPLHACGPHDGIHPDMFDFAVSSYTPTLSALRRAKSQNTTPSAIESKAHPRTLVLSQPDIPGHTPLPCALQELQIIDSIFGRTMTALVGAHGTVARAEALLPRHAWLHVSTHGTQNVLEPLESALELYDGPLTLARLAQVRVSNAEFAFLSACHSAKGTFWIPNESMHLAGGLMFAGYKSVVATMWGIADKDVPEVVGAFYMHLVRDGRLPSGTDTARALHVAVRSLRASRVPVFRWVPFIHLGA